MQWWLWVPVMMIDIFVTGYSGLTIIQKGISFGALFPVIFLLCFTIAAFSLTLETEIRQDGIYIRFFPFQLSYHHYSWQHIRHISVRQYSPIREYGGRGFRGTGKNQAWNVSGNKGLQLELTDRRKILIGTKKPEELTDVIELLEKNGLSCYSEK